MAARNFSRKILISLLGGLLQIAYLEASATEELVLVKSSLTDSCTGADTDEWWCQFTIWKGSPNNPEHQTHLPAKTRVKRDACRCIANINYNSANPYHPSKCTVICDIPDTSPAANKCRCSVKPSSLPQSTTSSTTADTSSPTSSTPANTSSPSSSTTANTSSSTTTQTHTTSPTPSEAIKPNTCTCSTKCIARYPPFPAPACSVKIDTFSAGSSTANYTCDCTRPGSYFKCICQ